jgi:hypothetical protein
MVLTLQAAFAEADSKTTKNVGEMAHILRRGG